MTPVWMMMTRVVIGFPPHPFYHGISPAFLTGRSSLDWGSQAVFGLGVPNCKTASFGPIKMVSFC